MYMQRARARAIAGAAFGAAALVVAVVAVACGPMATAAPCSRDGECASGERCAAGFCAADDGFDPSPDVDGARADGGDGGRPSGGDDGGEPGDGDDAGDPGGDDDAGETGSDDAGETGSDDAGDFGGGDDAGGAGSDDAGDPGGGDDAGQAGSDDAGDPGAGDDAGEAGSDDGGPGAGDADAGFDEDAGFGADEDAGFGADEDAGFGADEDAGFDEDEDGGAGFDAGADGGAGFDAGDGCSPPALVCTTAVALVDEGRGAVDVPVGATDLDGRDVLLSARVVGVPATDVAFVSAQDLVIAASGDGTVAFQLEAPFDQVRDVDHAFTLQVSGRRAGCAVEASIERAMTSGARSGVLAYGNGTVRGTLGAPPVTSDLSNEVDARCEVVDAASRALIFIPGERAPPALDWPLLADAEYFAAGLYVTRTDGDAVLPSSEALWARPIPAGFAGSEDWAWTGLDASGAPSTFTCASWQSEDEIDSGTVGRIGETGEDAYAFLELPCDAFAAVLCVDGRAPP